MAYLKRRNKIWYIVFTIPGEDGTIKKIARTTGIKNHREANIALGKINEAELKGQINPYDPSLDVKKFLNTSYRNSSMMLFEAIPLFLEDNPHWRPTTLIQYETILWKWVETLGISYTMCETKSGSDAFLNTNHIKRYIFREGISDSTRKKELRHLKRFCNWLIDMNDDGMYDTRTTKNPCKGISIGRVFVDYHKKMLSKVELETLLNSFKAHQKQVKKNPRFAKWGNQNWFEPLMWVYFYTGCRRGEPLLCQLKHIIGDFEFFRMVNEKGQKIKDVYIKPELKKILKKHCKTLPTNRQNQYLFLSGKTGRPLSGHSVYDVFKKHLKKAGLPEERTIHGIRHFSVTEDLRNGVPINSVRDQHGHSTIQVTEIYEHLVTTDMQRHYDEKYKS